MGTIKEQHLWEQSPLYGVEGLSSHHFVHACSPYLHNEAGGKSSNTCIILKYGVLVIGLDCTGPAEVLRQVIDIYMYSMYVIQFVGHAITALSELCCVLL